LKEKSIKMSNVGFISRLYHSIQENRTRNAFCINNEYYTYAQLNELVSKILPLINADSPTRDTVGIVVANSIYTYATILACWFSGKAYVPINRYLPLERNNTILKNAEAALLINCTGDVVEGYETLRAIDVDAINVSVAGSLNLTQNIDEQTLLYILFTSGSTGVPKGVPICYENLDAFITSFDALGFEIKAADKFLQMFEFTFDVSIASFVVPLVYGACTYTVSSEGIKYINVLKILRDKQISFACLVPSIITYLKPYFDRIELPAVKYCILTAEASNVADIQKWKPCVPNAEIYNLYGPTEATIWCTVYKFDPSAPKSYNEMMAIGKPLLQVKAIIIDENSTVVTGSVKGQLCVAGKQVTAGYLNNAEKNAESFINVNGELYYKTGDLCYWDEEGDLYYCGRMDYQVKVNGHRIELGEIEAAVRKLYAINNVATLYKDKDGIDKICLFLENCEDVDALSDTLKKVLPYYMLPHLVKNMESFPINNSNKVDRVALKELV